MERFKSMEVPVQVLLPGCQGGFKMKHSEIRRWDMVTSLCSLFLS